MIHECDNEGKISKVELFLQAFSYFDEPVDFVQLFGEQAPPAADAQHLQVFLVVGRSDSSLFGDLLHLLHDLFRVLVHLDGVLALQGSGAEDNLLFQLYYLHLQQIDDSDGRQFEHSLELLAVILVGFDVGV